MRLFKSLIKSASFVEKFNFKYNLMKVKSIFIILVFILSQSVSAKVKLPAILGDNMVLQQQTTVNLWGTASPSKQVKVITSWNKKIRDQCGCVW